MEWTVVTVALGKDGRENVIGQRTYPSRRTAAESLRGTKGNIVRDQTKQQYRVPAPTS